ncbi:hypothetical protein TrVE_jg11287 [Triparma verrucosa]|uniref:Vesicle transport protein n=1 Tax=Triparma verrucosa TaxID=1606542 RepID=A0A9W7FK56_9STRA|nr:hypothetical protein TrVE_jg11287 [Triparma verrucosa]
MPNIIDNVRDSITGDSENDSICPKMSYTTRFYGFCGCFAFGWLITMMSFSRFVHLLRGEPVPFVLMYTLGNIISLCASMFLAGPKRQFKNMTDEKRRVVAIVYVISILSTLLVCFISMNNGLRIALLVTLLVTQFCALLWYTLSYIPYGRTMATACLKKNCLCCEMEEGEV